MAEVKNVLGRLISRKMIVGISLFVITAFMPTAAEAEISPDGVYFREAESANNGNPYILREQYRSSASNESAVLLGGQDINDQWISFDLSFDTPMTSAGLLVRYSDEDGGQPVRVVLDVYLDDVYKGLFTDECTGSWNTFIDSSIIDLNDIPSGEHTLKLVASNGGDYGIQIDYITISRFTTAKCLDYEGRITSPNVPSLGQITFSPNGEYAYAASAGSIAWFERNAVTGELGYSGSYDNSSSLVYMPGIVRVSANGEYVYVSYYTGVAWFTRNQATGALTYGGRYNSTEVQFTYLEITPDGNQLYLMCQAGWTSPVIYWFDIDSNDGSLTYVGEYQNVSNLYLSNGFEISNDGLNLYILCGAYSNGGGSVDSAVTWFTRDAGGDLTYIDKYYISSASDYYNRRGTDIEISADDKVVYVSTCRQGGLYPSKLLSFTRDAANDGDLTSVDICQLDTNNSYMLLEMSNDGRDLYASDNGDAVFWFGTNETGDLAFKTSYSDFDHDTYGPVYPVVSPDGKHLYANFSGNYSAGGSGIVQFKIIKSLPTIMECEDYTSITPSGSYTRLETEDNKSNASGTRGLHMGPDWNVDNTLGIGDTAVYTVDLPAYDNASIRIKYSDDVQYIEDPNFVNVIKVSLTPTGGTKEEKGQFCTFDTGGWNEFEWAPPIFLGNLEAGTYTITLEMVAGGSCGAILDFFEIRNASVDNVITNDIIAFIKSSINPNTGLVESREGDSGDWTTIFKNALAAMALLHEGDPNSAEGILSFYNSVYNANATDFSGFIKEWDAGTGQSVDANYWVGDNAFLLLALNYYDRINGGLGDYREMSNALVRWLTEKGNDCGAIEGEGVANMYAALAPFAGGNDDIDMALMKLKARFYEDLTFSTVLDHTARTSLVFGDTDGFDYLNNFERTETWDYDGQTVVSAYSDSDGEDYSNIEISAQILNAWGIWSSDLAIDLSGLENELGKLWLNGSNNPDSCGLPYYVTDVEFYAPYALPIIDPTCFMYYYYNNFNPYAPGEKYAAVSFDFQQCEDYTSLAPSDPNTRLAPDSKSNAIGGWGLHMGFDAPDEALGIGDAAIYTLNLQAYGNASIRFRYSDDVAGNVIKVYLDDVEKGQFTTSDTGVWNDFEWTEPIPIGLVTEGQHSIKLEMTTGGSYGLVLDVFKIESLMSPASRVIGWGYNYYGQAVSPTGADFIDVKAGAHFNVALRKDGSLYAWGQDDYWGACDVPSGNDYIAIGRAPLGGFAIKKDGSLVGWGQGWFNSSVLPSGNDYIAVDGLIANGLALKKDGSLVVFGSANNWGQKNVPSGNDYIAISGNYLHCLALKSDGSVIAWGYNEQGQCNVPAGQYTAISTDRYHSLAIKTDGSLAAWGDNTYGQCDVPSGNDFTAISAGLYHNVAMRADGSVVAWGKDGEHQINARAGVHYNCRRKEIMLCDGHCNFDFSTALETVLEIFIKTV